MENSIENNSVHFGIRIKKGQFTFNSNDNQKQNLSYEFNIVS